MWRSCSGIFPLYLVSEYPKSGGTWVTQLLAEALELPFYRNQLPKPRSSVMHGHHLYYKGFQNSVAMFRDGRDIMVSLYHHCMLGSNKVEDWVLDYYRSNVPFEDYENVVENMPQFIEVAFTSKAFCGFNLAEFAESWQDSPAVKIHYEKLLADSETELASLLAGLGRDDVSEAKIAAAVDKFSFKNQTGRERGDTDKASFLRKGISGDWKNHFNDKSIDVYRKFAGENPFSDFDS